MHRGSHIRFLITQFAAAADANDRTINALIELYEARHAAERDKGYDAQAAEWRAKLPEENGE